MAGASREVVIDFEFLRGRVTETVVKELCVACGTASETFRFKNHYKIADHGSSENCKHWADRHIEYKELHRVFTEAVAGFANLYAYGFSKITFLSTLTGRTIHNLEDVNCHPPDDFNHNTGVPCHATSSSYLFARPQRRNQFVIGLCTICKQKIVSNAHATRHVILKILLQPYKRDVHICQPRHSAMATRRKQSSVASKTPATRKKRMEQLEPTNICTYWPNNPAFNPKRLLLRRLFFIN